MSGGNGVQRNGAKQERAHCIVEHGWPEAEALPAPRWREDEVVLLTGERSIREGSTFLARLSKQLSN